MLLTQANWATSKMRMCGLLNASQVWKVDDFSKDSKDFKVVSEGEKLESFNLETSRLNFERIPFFSVGQNSNFLNA